MEQAFTKQDVEKEAKEYLKGYSSVSKKELKKIIWSDYTNRPTPYRRYDFARAVINKITWGKL